MNTLVCQKSVLVNTSSWSIDVLANNALDFCTAINHYMAITESTATRYTPVRYAKVKFDGSKQQQKQLQQQQQQQQQEQQQHQQPELTQ
jgi:hypothetical protein